MGELVVDNPEYLAFDAVVVKRDLWDELNAALYYVLQSERPWDDYYRAALVPPEKDSYCAVGACMKVSGVNMDIASSPLSFTMRPEKLPALCTDLLRLLFFAIPREKRDELAAEFRFNRKNSKYTVEAVREAAVINYNDKVLRNKDAIFRWFMVAEAHALR